MKLSKSLLVIPAASLLLGAAVLSGACGASVSYSGPAIETEPSGVVFAGGYAVGGTCTGNTYVTDESGNGYLVCDSGSWGYTATDPSADGYTVVGSGGGDGGTSTGTDSGSSTGTDSGTSTGTDSGSGGGGGSDAATGG